MSRSLVWRPQNKAIACRYSSGTVIDALERAFGQRAPWLITSAERDMLRGMYAASGDEGFEEILELNEKHGSIFLEVEV